MHTYSIDSDRRLKTVGLLGAVSLAVIRFGEQILSGISVGGYSALVLIPSFAVVFGIVFTVWNQYLWRIDVLQKSGLVKTPDLNGEWTGYIKTSYSGDIPDSALHPDNNEDSDYTKIEATLTVSQQWWRMQVSLSTEQSSSRSEGATLLIEDSRWPTLSYQYENDPDLETPDSLQLHYGTANLQNNIDEDGEILEGAYYTGPQRENHGEMYFEK